MQFSMPMVKATAPMVPGRSAIAEDHSDDDAAAPHAVDAAGTFQRVMPGEPAAPAKIIPLPEVYQRIRQESAEHVEPVPVANAAKKTSTATGPPVYVPGLQFVGKSVALKTTEKAIAATEQYLPPAPMLLLNALPGLAEITDEGEKFKRDMAMRPREADLEAYTNMPVEEFGKALLRGMGWKEGGAVGKSNAAVVEPIQYIPRPERLGLGAEPKAVPDEPPPDQKRRKILRPGEDESARNKQYEQPKTSDGRVKHYVSGSAELVVKKKLAMKPGAHVAIANGMHAGLVGTIAAVTFSGGLLVKLTNSGAEVAVRKEDAVLFDGALLRTAGGLEEVKRLIGAAKRPSQPDPAANGDRTLRDSASAEPNNGSASSSSSSSGKKAKHSSSGGGGMRGQRQSTWLTPGIVVRCISKTFAGGALYNKKLVVMDMSSVDAASAVLLEDRSKLVERVGEAVLETVVPPTGGHVRVVRGERSGEFGVLREKNSDKNRAVVEMDDDTEMVTLRMDDIAQYIGIDT